MKKIAIFLFEGVELFEVATFTDIFGWNRITGLKEFRDVILETVSYKEKIKCTWGGEIIPEKILTENNFQDLYSYDALIIPGGFGKAKFFDDKNNKVFKNLVKNFFENNKIILAVCSGVINLLETREIKNKKVTTYLLDNKRYFNQLKNFDVIPVEKEIIEDGNLITCSGAGNSIELALNLLERLTSTENKNLIKQNMFLK